MIAFGGLFGHALAVRLWRVNRLAAVLVGFGAALALTINLSNSLGAMAGRSNEKQAARLSVADVVRDASRDLKRSQDEREAMRITPTSAAAVEASRAASNATTKTREAECERRGSLCRAREDDERKALGDLSSVTSARAATETAAALDADIARLKQRIESAGPVLEANSQGSALARILDLPESWADWISTWQNFAMAIIAELLIVLSLIAFELLGKAKVTPVEVLELEPIAEPVVALPTPARPRLIASRQVPAGNVVVIMADLMEPGKGRTEFDEAYAAYDTACQRQGKRPVSPDDFSVALRRICKQNHIKIVSEGGSVFLIGVQIKDIPGVTYKAIDQYMLMAYIDTMLDTQARRVNQWTGTAEGDGRGDA